MNDPRFDLWMVRVLLVLGAIYVAVQIVQNS